MSTIADPTREEMLTYLYAQGCDIDVDEFDIEEAIYWFASDYHSGQASNLYSALSASPLKPGASSCGPEQDSTAADFYNLLVLEYT